MAFTKKVLRKFDTGQIVLILVLVTVVGLTVGLSLISRTITDIRISSQIEQSNRAFSAAEAGVESALIGNVIGGPTGTISLPNQDVSANFNTEAVGGNSQAYSFPVTGTNNSQTVWLTSHNSDGTLTESLSASYPATSGLDICWGSGDSNPAVILTLMYKEGTSYGMAKAAYDPGTVSRGISNNFLLADSSGNYCDSDFHFKKTVTATSDFGLSSSAILLSMKIRPLYDNTKLSVKPASGLNLPVQGKIITSVGRTNTGIIRKMQVIQSYPVLPAQMDFTLFSEN